MPTVYVVQEAVRRDPRTGGWQAVYDITPATVYGELEVLLPRHQIPVMTQPMIAELRHKLRNFKDDDYLLAMGDPVAIAAAAAVASDLNNGRFKMLRWDRQTRQYVEFAVDMKGRAV
jgi:hypothetical protein